MPTLSAKLLRAKTRSRSTDRKGDAMEKKARIAVLVSGGGTNLQAILDAAARGEIPDGGEIIAQKAVDILPEDTPETLQRRVMEQAEWIILPASVELISKEIVENKI